MKSEGKEDDDDDGNLPRRGGGPAQNKRKADFVADDDNLVDEPTASQVKGKNPKNRKSGHLALMELGNDDEAVPHEKPIKKPRAKKVKVEEKPESRAIEAKNDGMDKPPSRTAKNAREKTAEALKVDDVGGLAEAGSSPEDVKKAVKIDQLDGMSDIKTEAGVKAGPETATRPQGKKRRSRKPVKVEEVPEVDEEPKPRARKGRAKTVTLEEADEEAEDVVNVPVETEQETAPAPEPEEETKSKAKAGRKKGLAKPIPKARTSKSIPCPDVDGLC